MGSLSRGARSASVVIPVYNGSAWIGRALESVFAQTVRNLEVVVVDDGSTDDIESSLRAYQGRISLVRQRNAGAAAARNRGVTEARSEFVAFLDADDFWHPRKLEYQFAAFDRWPDATLCYTDCQHVNDSFSIPGDSELRPESDVLELAEEFESIFVHPYLGTPTVMMRRAEFTRLGGFREDLRSAEDVDLWLRAIYLGKAVRVRLPLTYIVPTPQSLSSRQGGAAFGNNLQVIEDFCRSYPEFARKSPRYVGQAKALVYENWASGELVAGNRKFAAELAANSIRNQFSWRAAYLLLKARIGL